jgi:hypothetical protein
VETIVIAGIDFLLSSSNCIQIANVTLGYAEGAAPDDGMT